MGTQLSIIAQSISYELFGTLLEQSSEEAVSFATIVLVEKGTDKILGGTKSSDDGSFKLKSQGPDAFLRITAIGFLPKEITGLKASTADLGKIYLERNSRALQEVKIQGEKSTTEFHLDKRVFNVGQDLSSSGAGALEVLNNVPSVNVNIEGEISLRGSNGVQILINGKPSVIANEQGNALGTITADMIERIEVITNPSAKYEAEGSAGILNIVLKKEKRKGVNGSASLNLGWPQNHSFGLSLNRRSEKFNLFSQLGAGYRELPRFGESINLDLSNNTSVTSEGEEYRNEKFYNFILGTDYYINKTNVLTLSGSIALEDESQPSTYNFISDDGNGNLSEWNRFETTTALNPKYQYELQYKKDFEDDEEHNLLFSAIGNFFGKDQSSSFQNEYVSGADNSGLQNTRTNFQEAKYTFNLDYTKPFAKFYTLETGAQYQTQDVSNDYEVSDFINNQWVIDEGLTNIFNYQQSVFGAYGTAAYEKDKFGLKLGLRAENTDLKTVLENTNETNDRNFTNLFPTLHSSYKINKSLSVQAGYSRRIYRPRLWDLNPFFNIRNNFSIRAGNPDLLPEFTNSYEIAAIYFKEKYSLNINFYQRNTSQVIERISLFESNVTTVRPENIGENYLSGLECNIEYSLHERVKLLSEFSYNYFNRVGTFNDVVFDFSADKWSAEVTTKIKLPKELDVEFRGEYQSRVQMIQGIRSAQLFANMGIRKKLLKKRAVINFSMRDIFASRIRETTINQADFYIYNRGYRGRFITLGFSYGFGKGEAMEFKGGRRR